VVIDPKWLTRIILGKDIVESHRKLILEWARERRPALEVMSVMYDSFQQKLILETTG
jgi:hypothetical protein